MMTVLLGERPTSSPCLAQCTGEAGSPLTETRDGDSRAPGTREQQGLGVHPRQVKPGDWLGSTLLRTAGRAGVGESPRSRWTQCASPGWLPVQWALAVPPHSSSATHNWTGTLRSHTPPYWPPVLIWSYFDAMKTLCLYIMFIYFKDLCQESIFNKK